MMRTLVLHPRYDEDSQLLWQAAIDAGWGAQRLTGYTLLSDLAPPNPVIYGGYEWARTIAEQAGLIAQSPRADVMARLPIVITKRSSAVMRADEIEFPTDGSGLFVKSLRGKAMDSRVYFSQDDLPPGSGVDEVIVQTPVHWDCEYRLFVLNGCVTTISRYAVNHALSVSNTTPRETLEVLKFANTVLARHGDEFGASAFVLDVGHVGGLDSHGYAVVEANPAWCSGIYGCNPADVLETVAASQ